MGISRCPENRASLSRAQSTTQGQRVTTLSYADALTALLFFSNPTADVFFSSRQPRARALQGWHEDLWIKRVRTRLYEPGGHYTHHFDWTANAGGWGRVSSMMGWVQGEADADVEGGGTEFPLLQLGGRWCRFVECEDAKGKQRTRETGRMSRRASRSGQNWNAVYWENLPVDGRGYEETWHAGLPVRKGVKVGLNIWSAGRIE